MPAPGITPTLRPVPPLEQLIVFGPTTGEPVMPSPTTGSSSALISPTLNGQPETNGLGPLVDGPPGSPVGLIAYRRLLARLSGLAPLGSWPSTPIVGSKLPALRPPSLPSLTRYSSLVPTTISGLPSPLRSATAGVSTIAPWFSAAPASDLKVSACVVGSIDWTFERSTTSTGNPATGDPSVPCHAYTWRSMPAATTSGLPSPSRSAITGEPRKPCCVRARLPLRTLTKGASGLPE